jgi:5-methyltetrahydrofolate--homocysteine methyltransferase
VNYIEADAIIKATLPGVKVSGGVSNLSFSVPRQRHRPRGDALGVPVPRDQGGHGHGIVNAGQLVVYEGHPKDLLEHVEDVIFNRRPDATEAARLVRRDGEGHGRRRTRTSSGAADRRGASRRSRSCTATSTSSIRTPRKRGRSTAAARHHRGPLMDGMKIVGDLFGSARCSCRRSSSRPRDEEAVAYLEPYMEKEKAERLAKNPLAATARGASSWRR